MPLSFSCSPQLPHPVPALLEREFIPSPAGQLELLYAIPKDKSEGSYHPPLFFVHGGFGCAAVWTEYMSLLSQAPYNIPCYAISLRGHGSSWSPNYLKMVFFTSKRDLADDIVTGVRHVQHLEHQRRSDEKRNRDDTHVVLVAHSNGGGLAQLALNDGDIRVSGLALLDATPPFGLLGVYWNWFKMDPWFGLRVNYHLGHPRSPLSSTRLVKQAFFCDDMPAERVQRFEQIMSPFESLIWPMAMFWRFVDIKNILRNIWNKQGRRRVLVMAAGKSRLMGVSMMERAANEYKACASELCGDDGRSTIDFEIVNGAGHHLQNDLQWEDGAKKLAIFYESC